MNPLRILRATDRWVAIDKPAGFQSHAPEDRRHRVDPDRCCASILRRQMGRTVHLVHRLDRATSGVLLAALDPEAARALGALFAGRAVAKQYVCVARGWIADDLVIDRPLKADPPATGTVEARTDVRPLAQVELPFAASGFETARYTLAGVEIHSGRRHQIRRHLAGAGHPLVGDTTHGSGEHNRLWRERLGIDGMLLKAHVLGFDDPFSGERVRLVSRWGGRWGKVFDVLGVCPSPWNG
jgi:tRNA pseudouridine65 synthase